MITSGFARTLYILLAWCLFAPSARAQVPAWAADTLLIYQFDIKETITPAAWRHTMRSVDEAEKLKADLILIHMNTYGGLVDAADSIRTKLLNTPIPVWVFIDNNAASAGALIAIACDSIYMRPGANIGAATVVGQDGGQLPDKYQSYMRATMRATAQAHGKRKLPSAAGDTVERWHRDPAIAEAMVDPEIEVEGISPMGKVLTFTTEEAIEHHYCEGTATTPAEVFASQGIRHYRLVQHQPTVLDRLIGFLLHPVVHSLLIMLIFGGIYFELQTPGIGFPLGAAAVGALLYFAPLYLEGLAENWELALFLLGLVLLAVEVLVLPGFGVAGVAGVALVLGGLVLSMVDNMGLFEMGSFNPSPLYRAFLVAILGLLVPMVLLLLAAPRLFQSGALRGLVLQSSQQADQGFVAADQGLKQHIGQQAKAYTALRPVGKIEIDGQLFDARATNGFIEPGTDLRVVAYQHGQLYVRPLPEA